MTYGSLCAGVGGIDLGLDRAGFQCRWQCEIEPFAVKVLEKHWPLVKRYGDIRKLTGAELEWVDCIAAGFPCQDLSQAGKRAGLEGSRSGLWFEAARIIGALRPRWVLLENVPGLLTMPGAMARVCGDLARLGYVGLNLCLRASDFGASHIRKRVFIVAYLEHAIDGGPQERRPDCLGTLRAGRSSDVRHEAPQPSDDLADRSTSRCGERGEYDSGTKAGEQGLSRWRRTDGCDTQVAVSPSRGLRERGEPSGGDGQLREPRRGPERRDGAGSAGADVSDGAPFAFAPGPADPRWPGILRDYPWLTPALESPFRGVPSRTPDWLDRAMSNRTKRLRCLGNSVVPACAEWVGRRILEAPQGEPEGGAR